VECLYYARTPRLGLRGSPSGIVVEQRYFNILNQETVQKWISASRYLHFSRDPDEVKDELSTRTRDDDGTRDLRSNPKINSTKFFVDFRIRDEQDLLRAFMEWQVGYDFSPLHECPVCPGKFAYMKMAGVLYRVGID